MSGINDLYSNGSSSKLGRLYANGDESRLEDKSAEEALRSFAGKTLDERRRSRDIARSEPRKPVTVERSETKHDPAVVKFDPPKGTPQIKRVTEEGTEGELEGAFYARFTDVDGDIFLQGGSINGLEVDTSALKLYDLSLDAWEGAAGTHLYVALTGAFPVVDGVAMPGFVAASAAPPAKGALPANTFPAVTGTTTASAGICHVSLGVFVDGGFMASRNGNRVVGLCLFPPYSGDV